jgi:hypothetical protein
MKPLRRSAIFWCGLFVLCFLMWLCVDSQWHRNGVVYLRRPLGQRWELQTHRGALRLHWDVGEYPAGYRIPGRLWPFHAWRHPDPGGLDWFPDFYGWEDGRRFFSVTGMSHAELMELLRDPSQGFPVRNYHVQVPIWALIVGFGVLWGLLLGWRRRRHRMES